MFIVTFLFYVLQLNKTFFTMEAKQPKFYMIREGFIKEIDKKVFDDKSYKDDYKIPSEDGSIKILDYDKRNIRPYTKELLNSMNELFEVKLLKIVIGITVGIIFFCFLIFLIVSFKGNGSKDTIKALTTTIEKTCGQSQTLDDMPGQQILENNKRNIK